MRIQPYVSSLCLLVAIALLIGCRKSEEAQKDQEPKDRIEAKALRTLPASSVSPLSYAKPLHWVQTRQQLVANLGDENLNLRYSPVLRRSTNSYTQNNTDPLEFFRSTSIAKGQAKNVEQVVFFPASMGQVIDESNGLSPNGRVAIEIQDRRLGTTLGIQNESISMLEDYQTTFVVLAKNVDTQSFWQRVSAIRWPQGVSMSSGYVRPFVCIPINSEDIREFFPSHLHGLGFTSTIYLHDIAADDFTEQQQQAILDWLHYGGRLIVNGPSTIAGLANSFLSPYLPLDELKNTKEGLGTYADKLNQFSLQHSTASVTLNPYRDPQEFGLPPSDATIPDPDKQQDGDDSNDDENRKELIERRIESIDEGMLAANFCSATLRSHASWVPECDGLLAECKVGEGRICMSTFDLAGQTITNWKSYGSFINAAVLRLPGREWVESSDGQGYEFTGPNATRERYLQTYSSLNRLATSSVYRVLPVQTNVDSSENSIKTPETKATSVFGGAGWAQNSYFGNLATTSLQQLSGIKVPPIDYLTKILSVYLVVLVPINWIIFRVFGRLEWAWMAIPIIAIGGAGVIARLLQVEIGFARSQNSIGLLELQNGYERAPLSRYMSIYTSLSTRFGVSLDENHGYVLPFATETRAPAKNRIVQYGVYDEQGSGIRGLPVRSHTAEMFQSDEIVELPGSLKINVEDSNKYLLKNDTGIQLRDLVWARSMNGETTYHWVGLLGNGQVVQLDQLESITMDQLAKRLNESLNSTTEPADGEGLEDQESSRNAALIQGLTGLLSLPSTGEYSDFVCGWTKNVISQVTVSPDPGQRDDNTLVCLSIPTSGFSPIEKDINLPPTDLIPDFELDLEE